MNISLQMDEVTIGIATGITGQEEGKGGAKRKEQAWLMMGE